MNNFGKQALFAVTFALFSWTAGIGEWCARPDSGKDTGGSCSFDVNECGWTVWRGTWRIYNKILRFETSNTQESTSGRLTSPQLCETGNRNTSLEFQYHTSDQRCQLSVLVGYTKVWTSDATNEWITLQEPIVISSPGNTFWITFQGIKPRTAQRLQCFISIDNVTYRNVPTTTSTTTSTFTTSRSVSPTATLLASTLTHTDQLNNETVTHSDETYPQPGPEEQTGADDSRTAIVVGAAVAAVVLAVVVVVFVVVWLRRGPKLSVLHCLKRKQHPPQSKHDSLKPGVHNAIYSTEDEQLTITTVDIGAKPNLTHKLASAPQSHMHCNTPMATVLKPASGNTSGPDNTYFELGAEAPTEGGQSPYEVADSTVFDEQYNTPDDTVLLHPPSREQGGDNPEYELASVPKPDSCYSRLTARNTDVRKNLKAKDQDQSPKHAAQNKLVDHTDGYNKLSHQPPTAADTNGDYSHLNQEKALQHAQIGMAEYSLAKPGDMKTTHPSNKGTGTNYVNVDLPTMPTEDEYNRLNLDGNHRMATAGGDAGGRDDTEYNHLNAEGFQKPQDDEYHSLNFEGPGQ